MGLAANVLRRGGVYWWRGRFAARLQPSRVVARSLRTRDPDVARVLGSQVTGLSVHLRQSVRQGVMTIEEAEGEISSFLTKFAFSVHPKVIAQLEAENANPSVRFEGDDRYSATQETAMLSDFVRRTLPILERQTAEARAYPPVVLDGVAEDWVAQAIRRDRLQAEVCRLLAVYGGSARVRPEDRADLLASGCSEDDVAEIERQLLRHAALEVGTDWKIGPERDVLVFHLQSVGAVPTLDNVARLRRATLFVLSNLLRAQAQTFKVVPDYSAVIAAGRAAMDSSGDVQTEQPSKSGNIAVATFEPPQASSEHEAPATTPASSGKSLIRMVEDLIKTKTQEKSREWDEKTARQHRSIAKLFAKVVGSDDPAVMKQEHVGKYLDLLRIIPTHYGKSAADEDRSIEEILSRSEDLDEDEIGLAPPTINRHRGQLNNILRFSRRHGYTIGVIEEDSRVRDLRAAGEKRAAFTADEGVQLMRVIEARSLSGDVADPDSLYWVPMLVWYEALRLSEAAGLVPADVDTENRVIHIRSNILRRTKTQSSVRTLPIHPELERLGFLEFARQAQTRGRLQLFPGLFTRAAEFGAVYQKMWTPVLDLALPLAREQRKTLHSTRKTGNSAMHIPAVKDNTRLYILGHAKTEVNGKHYLSPPSTAEMLAALDYIPIVTADLGRRQFS